MTSDMIGWYHQCAEAWERQYDEWRQRNQILSDMLRTEYVVTDNMHGLVRALRQALAPDGRYYHYTLSVWFEWRGTLLYAYRANAIRRGFAPHFPLRWRIKFNDGIITPAVVEIAHDVVFPYTGAIHLSESNVS